VLAGRWNLAGEPVRLTQHDKSLLRDRAPSLAENEIKPWRKDMGRIPQVDGEFVAGMYEGVLGLYAKEPDRRHAAVAGEVNRWGHRARLRPGRRRVLARLLVSLRILKDDVEH
jgi:hypothetical protein